MRSPSENKPAHKDRKPELFLGIGTLVVTISIILFSTVPAIAQFVDATWGWVQRVSEAHGYLGAFVSSLLANAAVVIPIPYTVIILVIGAAGLNPLLLGLIAGLGAGVGQITSYLVGLLGYRLGKEELERNTEALRKIIAARPWFAYFALFLVGATPIPDDLVMIPMGILRFNVFKAMLPFMFGKLFITIPIAYIGSLRGVSAQLGDQKANMWLNALTLLGTIVIIYAMMKVDWARIGHRMIKKHHDEVAGTEE